MIGAIIDTLALLVGVGLVFAAGWMARGLREAARRSPARLQALVESLTDDEVERIVHVISTRPVLYDGAYDFKEHS